jgi:uncharacterized delta-60 repeat protein
MPLLSWLRPLAARLSSPRPRATAPRRSFRPRLEALEARDCPAGGLLDPTFGTAGITVTDTGPSVEAFTSVVAQANGTLLAAGYANGNFTLARYTAAGALDSSFGSGGVTTLDFAGYNADGAYAVALQPGTGKILVAGRSSSRTGLDFAVARFNADGTLDTTFGGGKKPTGKVSIDLGGADRAFSMAVLSDGSFILAGIVASAANVEDGKLALAKFNANGTLATSFGTGGTVVTNLTAYTSVGLTPEHSVNVAVDANGRVVVAATSAASPTTGRDFLVARFTSAGALDTSFGTAGVVRTDIASGSTDHATALALQSDGKILVAGIAIPTGTGQQSTPAALVRYRSDGTLDTSFSGDGIATAVADPSHLAGAWAQAMAVQSDGKILLAGNAEFADVPGLSNTFLLMRFNGDGSLDTAFGPSGTGAVVTTDGSNARISALALQADGRAVVAGTLDPSSGSALARYLVDGPRVSAATVTPSPAPAGTDVTVAASVTAGNPGALGAVTQVAVYADSNGDGKLDPATDLLLGYAIFDPSDGQWKLTISTAGWTPGSHRLFARATDGYGADGDPLTLDLEVV